MRMGILIQQVLLLAFLAMVGLRLTIAEPNFPKALEIVVEAADQAGNINYTTFCRREGQGTFKLGCQIDQMPDVGLLVCLKAEICESVLANALSSLTAVSIAELRVVPFYNKVIEG